jgi:hypothetical protein
MTGGSIVSPLLLRRFSGARLAGANTWITRLVPAPLKSDPHRLRLILAGLGAMLGGRQADHRAIARHPRCRRGGRMFV